MVAGYWFLQIISDINSLYTIYLNIQVEVDIP